MSLTAFKDKLMTRMIPTYMHIILYLSPEKTTVSENSLLYAGITLITCLVRCVSRIWPWRLFVVEKKGYSYIIGTYILLLTTLLQTPKPQWYNYFVLRDCTIIILSRVIVSEYHILWLYLYTGTGSVGFFFHVSTSVSYVSR